MARSGYAKSNPSLAMFYYWELRWSGVPCSASFATFVVLGCGQAGYAGLCAPDYPKVARPAIFPYICFLN